MADKNIRILRLSTVIIGSLRNEDDDGYEDFISRYSYHYETISCRFAKCVVTVEELNWYEWVGSVERELKIPRHVLTSSTEP